MVTKKNTTIIQSLQTGLNILDIFSKEKRPLKFTEIQQETGILKSNLYKYLNTLCLAGVLYRDPYSNAYYLGNKLAELGSLATSNTSFVEYALPFFKEINQQTNLTALLAVPSINGPFVAHIYTADYGINIGAQIGTHLPLTSATGQLFSAFEKSEQLKKWETPYFEQMTEEQKKNFLLEQQKVKENYFSSKIEPLVEHVSSFSVPILDYQNKLVGAITVVGFTSLIPNDPKHPTSQLVLKAANNLSEYYGFSIKRV